MAGMTPQDDVIENQDERRKQRFWVFNESSTFFFSLNSPSTYDESNQTKDLTVFPSSIQAGDTIQIPMTFKLALKVRAVKGPSILKSLGNLDLRSQTCSNCRIT